jgi:hypothetical protein
MLQSSFRLVTYYKFLKSIPYIDLKNTYFYFLSIRFFFKKFKKIEYKLILSKTFIYSYRTKTITIFKTPMAHKNWSKEQIFIKYNLLISNYRNIVFKKNITLAVLFKIIYNFSKLFKQSESSVMFIKNILISYKFNYYIKFYLHGEIGIRAGLKIPF